MSTPRGLNGQPVIQYGDPNLVTIEVPGGVKLTVHRRFARIAAYVARRFHEEVEPLQPGQCWGYSYRPARGSSSWSSHATGYCIDLNSNGAGSMLWGADKLKATPKQLRAMAQIKKDTGLLWGGPTSYGGDYSSPQWWDPMHYDLPPGVDGPAWCRALVKRLGIQKDGSVTPATPKPPTKPATPRPPVTPKPPTPKPPTPKPPTKPTVPSGKGPRWLLEFLRAVGCPPAMERAWWSIGMRESGGDPDCRYPDGAPFGDWGRATAPFFDTGVFQINNRHLPAVRTMFGPHTTMQSMLDPAKTWRYAQTLNWLDWGLVIAADGASYRFDWSRYPAEWVAKYAKNSEAGFRHWWKAYPGYAQQSETPKPETPKPETPKPETPKPDSRPVVSVSDVQPGSAGRPVRLVQKALSAEGIDPGPHDGLFGPKTQAAYAIWQRRCGWTGTYADGSPGMQTLTELGRRHGFAVTR